MYITYINSLLKRDSVINEEDALDSYVNDVDVILYVKEWCQDIEID